MQDFSIENNYNKPRTGFSFGGQSQEQPTFSREDYIKKTPLFQINPSMVGFSETGAAYQQ